MGTIVLEEPYVDPAGQLFVYAMDLADSLSRRHRACDCMIEVKEDKLKSGWRGWLLREKAEGRPRFVDAWDMGQYARADIVRMALARNGIIYFTREPLHGGGDQLLVLIDIVELDYHHFGDNYVPSEGVQRLLDRLAASRP